ncbi:MAG: hypothetical protein AB3N20_09280 [Rhizobiaceae bacterium]
MAAIPSFQGLRRREGGALLQVRRTNGRFPEQTLELSIMLNCQPHPGGVAILMASKRCFSLLLYQWMVCDGDCYNEYATMQGMVSAGLDKAILAPLTLVWFF